MDPVLTVHCFWYLLPFAPLFLVCAFDTHCGSYSRRLTSRYLFLSVYWHVFSHPTPWRWPHPDTLTPVTGCALQVEPVVALHALGRSRASGWILHVLVLVHGFGWGWSWYYWNVQKLVGVELFAIWARDGNSCFVQNINLFLLEIIRKLKSFLLRVNRV